MILLIVVLVALPVDARVALILFESQHISAGASQKTYPVTVDAAPVVP